jgi:hypothetical protein
MATPAWWCIVLTDIPSHINKSLSQRIYIPIYYKDDKHQNSINLCFNNLPLFFQDIIKSVPNLSNYWVLKDKILTKLTSDQIIDLVKLFYPNEYITMGE